MQATTLDYQTGHSDEGEISRGVKVRLNLLAMAFFLTQFAQLQRELEASLSLLAGKMRGGDRRKKWEDVKHLCKEYRQREAKVTHGILQKSSVVLSTCHGAGGSLLQSITFDVVIIDEATQALEAACWISALQGKKLILVSD